MHLVPSGVLGSIIIVIAEQKRKSLQKDEAEAR